MSKELEVVFLQDKKYSIDGLTSSQAYKGEVKTLPWSLITSLQLEGVISLKLIEELEEPIEEPIEELIEELIEEPEESIEKSIEEPIQEPTKEAIEKNPGKKKNRK